MRIKVAAELVLAVGAVFWVTMILEAPLDHGLALPFVKSVLLDIGWFTVPFAAFVVIGSSNAVNLTDGLDGLAIVPIMIAAACFALIAYVVGNTVFTEYLQVHHVPGTGELSVFCGALVGAGLGFLWFNAPPAMVFMGDTGSLSTGAALGIIAVMTKHEIVLAIVGGLVRAGGGVGDRAGRLVQAPGAAGSSRWRLCTITSSRRGSRSPPSSSASG